MTVKARLEYGPFVLDLEGPEQFVSEQLNAFASRIPAVAGIEKPSVGATAAPAAIDEDTVPKEKKKTRRTSTGPSCASRISPLVEEGFFDTPRTSNEVGERLKEKATPYEGKHVAASLIDLTKRGTVRRVKQDSTWHYVKP